MFRLLAAVLLFGIIFGLARSLGRPGPADQTGEAQELVQDALTGVYFPKSAAVKVIRGGETLHFQSLENRDRFLNLNR